MRVATPIKKSTKNNNNAPLADVNASRTSEPIIYAVKSRDDSRYSPETWAGGCYPARVDDFGADANLQLNRLGPRSGGNPMPCGTSYPVGSAEAQQSV